MSNAGRRSGIVPFWGNDAQRKNTDVWYNILLLTTLIGWLLIVGFALILPLISSTNTGLPKIDPNSYDHSKSAIPQYFSEVIMQSTVGVFEIMKSITRTVFGLSPVTASLGVVFVFACVSGLLRVVRWKYEGWSMTSLWGLNIYIIFLCIINIIMVCSDFDKAIKSFNELLWRTTRKFDSLDGDSKIAIDYSDNYGVSLVRNYRSIELNQTTSNNYVIKTVNTLSVFIMNCIIIGYSITATISVRVIFVPPEIEKIFKNTFSIFFFFYRVVFIVMIMFGLQILVMYLSSIIFALPRFNSTFKYIVLLAGLYLNNVMLYYMVMVIAQLTATWHWAIDKAKLRSRLIRQSMACVAKRHMGTIAFNATVILPVIGACIVPARKKLRATGYIGILDILLVLYLIPNIMEYSIVATALKGQSFTEATHTAYQTYTRKSKMSLAFTFGFKMTIFLITLIITQLSGLCFIFANLLQILDLLVLNLLAYNFYGLILRPFIIVLTSVEKANLFCAMENMEHEERVVQSGAPMRQLGSA